MATMPPPAMLAQLLQKLGGAGGPGGPPGGPGGPPPPDLGGVQKMAAAPPGQEAPIFNQVMDGIGFLMQRYSTRAPEVSRELATSLVHVKKAMDKSATLPAEPVSAPPPNMPAAAGMMGDLSQPGMPPLGV